VSDPKTRKCHRLDKVAVDFMELRKGDLFVLEEQDLDDPAWVPVEDGTTVNLADEDARMLGGVPTIQCSQVGKTCVEQGDPVHPDAVAWKATAEQHVRNETHLREDRDKLLRAVYGAGSLKELQRDLTAEGYHRLIKETT